MKTEAFVVPKNNKEIFQDDQVKIALCHAQNQTVLKYLEISIKEKSELVGPYGGQLLFELSKPWKN